MKNPEKIEALFISDVHLGSRGSKTDRLLTVLKKYQPERVFIIGDFIDGWLLKKRMYWTQGHTNVLRKILSYTKNNSKVVYITGNHDDFLRAYTPIEFGENLQILDECIWNRMYIVHGDQYDGIVQWKWLGRLGTVGLELAIVIDRLQKRIGSNRSIAKWLKTNVKNAVKFITDFEERLVLEAEKRGCRTVVCGHIHQPVVKTLKEITYVNTGDWIENCSYVVWNNGEWSVLYG